MVGERATWNAKERTTGRKKELTFRSHAVVEEFGSGQKNGHKHSRVFFLHVRERAGMDETRLQMCMRYTKRKRRWLTSWYGARAGGTMQEGACHPEEEKEEEGGSSCPSKNRSSPLFNETLSTALVIGFWPESNRGWLPTEGRQEREKEFPGARKMQEDYRASGEKDKKLRVRERASGQDKIKGGARAGHRKVRIYLSRTREYVHRPTRPSPRDPLCCSRGDRGEGRAQKNEEKNEPSSASVSLSLSLPLFPYPCNARCLPRTWRYY